MLNCPGFYLHIDYLTSFPTGSTVEMSLFSLDYFMRPPLLLCLMHGNECVSSITMKVRESEISIDSRTNEHYQRRKFNTLLRAVAIIVSKSLSERAERLTSCATNKTSARLMIMRFNATRLDKTAISYDTLDELNKIMDDAFSIYGGMDTMVELNERNIVKAMSVFHETIPMMNCRPLEGGRRKCTRKVIKSKKHNKRSNKRFHK